ncbi:MAG TPA: TerC family protein [Steroidobacteraceae bacterium]|nr:TerC family protein [Steroidobacteraceae bacterium]
MLELLTDPSAWLSFVTLTVLEVVLGIDNIVFLAILVSRLPAERQASARLGGLALAMLTRIALLLSITWLIALQAPLFTLLGREISSRDLVLLLGGLFLLWKSVTEIHSTMLGTRAARNVRAPRRVTTVIVQIALIDIVFSFDSVFTAVGLAQRVEIMVAAIVAAVFFMMFVARGISSFIDRYPTLKMLALAFLLLIGLALILDAVDVHIPKGYLYFAMAFSIGVEMINLRVRRQPPAR